MYSFFILRMTVFPGKMLYFAMVCFVTGITITRSPMMIMIGVQKRVCSYQWANPYGVRGLKILMPIS